MSPAIFQLISGNGDAIIDWVDTQRHVKLPTSILFSCSSLFGDIQTHVRHEQQYQVLTIVLNVSDYDIAITLPT